MKIRTWLAFLPLCLCAAASLPAHAETIPYDEVSPEQAYTMVTSEENTYILDIRTSGEYFWVGHPGEDECGEGGDLRGKVFHLPYKVWKFDRELKRYVMVLNPVFGLGVAKRFDPGDHVILMSRDGMRSLEAVQRLVDSNNSGPFAWSVIGGLLLSHMAEGFEGGLDECGYRTLDEGWKNLGLPYNNSPEGLWRQRHPGGPVILDPPLQQVEEPLSHEPTGSFDPRGLSTLR